MHAAIRAAALLIAVSACSPAYAQGVVDDEIDCSVWLRSRSQNRAQVLEAFVQGMLGGLAIGTRRKFWDSRKGTLTPDQAFMWLDNWCQAKPKTNAVIGVLTLWDERADR
jgi:hypothetical protein